MQRKKQEDDLIHKSDAYTKCPHCTLQVTEFKMTFYLIKPDCNSFSSSAVKPSNFIGCHLNIPLFWSGVQTGTGKMHDSVWLMLFLTRVAGN